MIANQQLSIGNTINLGIKLYRHHLKLYLKLSAIAHLWLLFPIYGWAKFLGISALISRLVFEELSDRVIDLNDAFRQTNRQKWKFLKTTILVLISFILVTILVIIALFLFTILAYVILYVFALTTQAINLKIVNNWLGLFMALLIYLFIFLGIFWIYSRLFVAEMPLLTEDCLRSIQAIKHSWRLTKGMVKHIQGVMAIAFLVSFPVLWMIWFFGGRAMGFLLRSLPLQDYHRYEHQIVLFYVVIASLLGGTIFMPFWQAIKAILYYDLRKQESYLKLSDRHFFE
jgi:hypothetical protein